MRNYLVFEFLLVFCLVFILAYFRRFKVTRLVGKSAAT